MSITVPDLLRLRRSTFDEFRSRPPRVDADAAEPMFAIGRLAFCPVTQLLKRAGVEKTLVQSEADRAKMLKKFERGNRIEREVIDAVELSGLLISRQVALYDPELQVRGYADMLWGGEFRNTLPYWVREPDHRWKVQEFQQRAQDEAGGPVPITLTEVKSTASYSLKRMREAGEPAIWYRPQLACYALVARRHPELLDVAEVERFQFVVTGEDEDDLSFELDESDVDAVEDRVGMLAEAWTTGEWPPCECGQVEGMGWAGPGPTGCDYTDPEDMSACCNRTLADRLRDSIEATA